MEILGDDILLDCINNSGYYEYKDVNLDDLPNDKRISIILAGELLALRPELKNPDSNLVYIQKTILETGKEVYSLPSKSLSNFLKEPPYTDSSIWTYSLEKNKLMKKVYKGNGRDWEKIK